MRDDSQSPVPGKRIKDMSPDEKRAYHAWRKRIYRSQRRGAPKPPPNGKRLAVMTSEERRLYNNRKQLERKTRIRANPKLWAQFCRDNVRHSTQSRARRREREKTTKAIMVFTARNSNHLAQQVDHFNAFHGVTVGAAWGRSEDGLWFVYGKGMNGLKTGLKFSAVVKHVQQMADSALVNKGQGEKA
jgi:hypothetical protein